MTFFSTTYRMLTGHRATCVGCNQAIGQTSNIVDYLCNHCSLQIPWISNIHCDDCGRQIRCTDCIRRRADELDWLEYHRATVEYTSLMKSWLAHYKYRGNQRWLHVMSHMLHRIWQKEYANLIDFITYVPVSTQRLQERTFNQAEQLARQLSTINKVPVQPLLHRRLDTAKQSSKSRLERSEMMDDVFECIDDMHDLRLNVQNARILIIDDVYTTGNTMHACARAIRQNWKAKIYGLSWARS